MKVVKRDGTIQDFCADRIETAVYKAALDTGYEPLTAQELAGDTARVVANKVTRKGEMTVEAIQDAVEDRLMSTKLHKDVARKYVLYRAERCRVREHNSDLKKQIDGFLYGTDDTHSKENSNKSAEQIVTHRDLIAGIVSKQYARSILPADVREAHEKGLIHVHDQDYMISPGIHNCGVYDFEYMLANGVKLGDVEIKTPRSVMTASLVMSQILSKVSGSSYGGQSVHEFDKVLKPYADKSLAKLKIKQERRNGYTDKAIQEDLAEEIYSACQSFIHQIQTVTGNNGQSSFCSISLSLSEDPMCKLIKEQYLKCHMEGIGPNKVSPIFPKVLYFVEDGVNLNEGDPNYKEFQLALECSSKRMYPDYIMAPNNRKMTGSKDNVITPMGKP